MIGTKVLEITLKNSCRTWENGSVGQMLAVLCKHEGSSRGGLVCKFRLIWSKTGPDSEPGPWRQ